MAGDGSPPDSAFTGWRYYFNTYTQKGRKNVNSVDYLRRFLLGHHDLAIKGEKEKGYRRKEALIPLDRKPP
ncbi:hypothetical protein KSF78_0005219 [Schistosoma japonicum]|nr:hypothetical protein KSF78_0005219 [Schistosoma japonicum]